MMAAYSRLRERYDFVPRIGIREFRVLVFEISRNVVYLFHFFRRKKTVNGGCFFCVFFAAASRKYEKQHREQFLLFGKLNEIKVRRSVFPFACKRGFLIGFPVGCSLFPVVIGMRLLYDSVLP